MFFHFVNTITSITMTYGSISINCPGMPSPDQVRLRGLRVCEQITNDHRAQRIASRDHG